MLTRLRRRAWLIQHRTDAGVTLIELVVAMSLTSVIGALALSAFLVMGNASGATVDRNLGTAYARNVAEQWTALLQLADSPTRPGQTSDRITSITPTEIVFYADLDNRSGNSVRGCPTMLDLSLTAGRLVQKRTPFTDAACTQLGTTSTTYLLGDASTTVGTPSRLFTAYDSSGQRVTTAPYGSVVRVDVAFQVTTRRDTSPVTFVSTAALTKGTS